MAERRFKLPGEEELNKDQDRVLALPEDGQYLVVGGKIPKIAKNFFLMKEFLWSYQSFWNSLIIIL